MKRVQRVMLGCLALAATAAIGQMKTSPQQQQPHGSTKAGHAVNPDRGQQVFAQNCRYHDGQPGQKIRAEFSDCHLAQEIDYLLAFGGVEAFEHLIRNCRCDSDCSSGGFLAEFRQHFCVARLAVPEAEIFAHQDRARAQTPH